ncbi:MAG TPA: endolytic transglycosylase MltG, partial [bacterium]|nr:endolytic transglycosylase MltG [bacterium]
DWSRPITAEDKATDSPYNTYKNKGLPPAAICNPGRAALEAAFMPPDTTYLYFISLPSGETKFFATLDEHVKLKNDLKQARQNTAAETAAGSPVAQPAGEPSAEPQPEAATTPAEATPGIQAEPEPENQPAPQTAKPATNP